MELKLHPQMCIDSSNAQSNGESCRWASKIRRPLKPEAIYRWIIDALPWKHCEMSRHPMTDQFR